LNFARSAESSCITRHVVTVFDSKPLRKEEGERGQKKRFKKKSGDVRRS